MSEAVSYQSESFSGVRFHEHSGLRDIEPSVEYAAIVLSPSLPSLYASTTRLVQRPVKVTWAHGVVMVVEDPDAGPEEISMVDSIVLVLGRWTDKIGAWYLGPDAAMTWQQYAAQQYGEVLRQRDLAQRLTDFGIPRAAESYLPQNNTANAVQRSLTLNFDELDQLLRAVGF